MIQSAINSLSTNGDQMSLLARWGKWREDRRQQRQRDEEKRREEQRLMPQSYADGLLLPITGDYVVAHYVNGIAVRSGDSKHEVVVSTPAKEYVVPCSTKEEAETVRRNIALAGHLLHSSGGY